MVHVYTGNGKGKTTAALGLSFRAAGRGFPVLFLCFLKDGNSGEVLLAKTIQNIEIRCFQTTVNGFYWNMPEKDRGILKNETQKGLDAALAWAQTHSGGVLVLDEIAGCIANGLLSKESVTGLIQKFGQRFEIVLTGRDMPDEIVSLADYVSEIVEIKHPYKANGTAARQGIEY